MSVEYFNSFVSGGITSHRIAKGTLGILAGLFYLSIRPPQCHKSANFPSIMDY